MASQDKERQEAINQLSQLTSRQWQALEFLMAECRSNADDRLHAYGMSDRDYYAGKCSGIDECLNIKKVVEDELAPEK